MAYPFEKINGKPIDLSNKEHRDIAIKRQKTLENAIENGLCISKVKVNVFVDVEFDCLKCGTPLDERVSVEDGVDIFHYELETNIAGKKIQCNCCNTKYTYSYQGEVFYVRPVDQLKEQLKKAKR